MNPYNPTDWYWYVGGDQTKAYSSKAGDYVPVSNAAFQSWLAGGGMPTSIDTEENLGGVLAEYSLRPVTANILDGYRNSRVDKITFQDVAVYLYQHENRTRALERAAGLNGSPANLTPNQFRNMLRNMV